MLACTAPSLLVTPLLLYVSACYTYSLTDEGLVATLREAPQRCIILLEDVDAVFLGRELQDDWRGSRGITFRLTPLSLFS